MEEKYKESCIKIFKEGFTIYKKNKNKNDKINDLESSLTKDYQLFIKLSNSFKIFQYMIKFLVCFNKNIYLDIIKEYNINSVDELVKLEINLPFEYEDLYQFFKKYPSLIEELNDLYLNILHIKDFDEILILNKINPLFYYSVANKSDIIDMIVSLEQSIINFTIYIKQLVKISLKKYITLFEKIQDSNIE